MQPLRSQEPPWPALRIYTPLGARRVYMREEEGRTNRARCDATMTTRSTGAAPASSSTSDCTCRRQCRTASRHSWHRPAASRSLDASLRRRKTSSGLAMPLPRKHVTQHGDVQDIATRSPFDSHSTAPRWLRGVVRIDPDDVQGD